MTLSFLERFTTQEQADWLSAKRLATWFKSVSYRGGVTAEVLHARGKDAPRGIVGPHAQTHAVTTRALIGCRH